MGRWLPQEVYSVCFHQDTGYLPRHLQQIIKVTDKKVLNGSFNTECLTF